jgi:hypothetical protein
MMKSSAIFLTKKEQLKKLFFKKREEITVALIFGMCFALK